MARPTGAETGLQFVKPCVDRLQTGAVTGTEIKASGDLGYLAQGGFIEIDRGVNITIEDALQTILLHAVSAYADSENTDTLLGSQPCSLDWRYFAGGIRTISYQQHYPA